MKKHLFLLFSSLFRNTRGCPGAFIDKLIQWLGPPTCAPNQLKIYPRDLWSSTLEPSDISDYYRQLLMLFDPSKMRISTCRLVRVTIALPGLLGTSRMPPRSEGEGCSERLFLVEKSEEKVRVVCMWKGRVKSEHCLALPISILDASVVLNSS